MKLDQMSILEAKDFIFVHRTNNIDTITAICLYHQQVLCDAKLFDRFDDKILNPVRTYQNISRRIIMSKTANQFDTLLKEAKDFNTNYSEACSKSGTIFMKGMEDIVSTMVSLGQESAEKQSRFLKEVMGCKTINELAEAQNKIAQSGFDDFMNGATKISEISVKIFTDSIEPVNAQISKVVEKATQSVAA